MNEHILFLIGLLLLIIHEIDAIRCKEWQIFPGLSLLSEKTGKRIFIFAHIPLFMLLFYQLIYNQNNDAFIKGFDIFMIVHIALHVIFLKHKNNEFKDWISWILISGAGICGIFDLLIF